MKSRSGRDSDPARRRILGGRSRRGWIERALAVALAAAVAALLWWVGVFQAREELPADTRGRVRLLDGAARRASSPWTQGAPGPAMLWRLTRDDNHFVRGRALEALAALGQGRTLDAATVAQLSKTAGSDTDFNRRGACALLLQLDLGAGIGPAANLFASTTNPNTRQSLLETIRAFDAPARRTALEAATRTGTDETRRRFARAALEALRTGPGPAR
ncbi:MAG: hypothetical protein HY815_22455 [Candidatus Riflebacteria bacterium]|nr:hypothetical protein [Candidatus Riflebacteria bacterium]